MGIALENEDGTLYRFMQKNKVCVGNAAEIISPGRVGTAMKVQELYLPDGERIPSTPHPFMIFWCRCPFKVRPGDIMRSADR